MATPAVMQQSSESTGKAPACMPFKPYDLDCIAQAHTILCKDPTARIRNKELAMEVGINRNKLHYGFKHVYGTTINHFLEQQRMEKAELLLTSTYKSVKTIAALTGYCTSSRFCNVFKKTFGITPYQYRKQMQENVRRCKCSAALVEAV